MSKEEDFSDFIEEKLLYNCHKKPSQSRSYTNPSR
jgi:hypothetical protein